jgi:DNA polymerase-3 subunit beta
MKITLLPERLREALDVALKAHHPGPATYNIPALGHVLLEARDDTLTVTGTDLETRAWRTVLAEVERPGAVTMAPSTLRDLTDVVPGDEPLTIEVDEKHRATLTCGRVTVRSAGLDPEQFPAIPDFSDPVTDLTFAADLLAVLIGSVAHAVGTGRSQSVYAGIYVRIADGTLLLAAADGYRLAVRSAPIDDQSDLTMVVLGKPLIAAGALLAKATSVRLLVDSKRSMVLLDSEIGCWAIRLVEAQFPDFNRVIPPDCPILVTVDRAALAAAARLVKGITSSHEREGRTFQTSRADLGVRDGSLELRAGDATGDHSADTVLDAELIGEPLTIGFDSGYLRDAVGAFSSERVVLELQGPALPALVREPGERNGHLQVLMPMHIARRAS